MVSVKNGLLALAIVALSVAGCGEKDRISPELAASKSTPVLKKVADDGAPAPQPIRCWGQIRGDDVEFHWVDGTLGDFNRDGVSNGQDLFLLATRFDKPTDYDEDGPGQEQDFDNCIDGNRDGVINGLDLFTLAANFGAKATWFELYDSHEGGDYALISATPVERPIDAEVCLPEFTLTIEGAASEGLHRFAIVAANDKTSPAPEDGSPVVIDVPPAWCLSGLDPDAIWPRMFHDHRQTSRSPYTGPREFSAGRFNFSHYPLSRNQASSYAGHATDAECNSYLTPNLSSGQTSSYELEKFNLRSDESIWTAPAESDVSKSVNSALLSDGSIAMYVIVDSDVSAKLKRFTPEAGNELDLELLDNPELNYYGAGDFSVTCGGNLLVAIHAEEGHYRTCFSPEGEFLWEFPIRNIARDHAVLSLPPDKVIMFDNGKLFCLRESDGEQLWEYTVHEEVEDLYSQIGDLVSVNNDEFYFTVAWYDYDNHHNHYFGHLDADKNEIAFKDLGSTPYYDFTPLDDGTAYVIRTENDSSRTFMRVTLDDLVPIWSVSSGQIIGIVLVDAEGYSYISTTSWTYCYDADGSEVWNGNTGNWQYVILPEHDLWSFADEDPTSLSPWDRLLNK